MPFPSFLQKNDAVALVAPAMKVKQKDLAMSIKIFEEWGLKVYLGEHIFHTHFQFAGTDQERAKDFQEALNSNEVKAIICARGGYGTLRIIDQLNFDKFMVNPKWIVGFSDVTVLHNHLHQLNIASIHGGMPLLFPKQTESSIETLRKMLFGESLEITTPSFHFNRQGEIDAEIIGGNLTLFANTIGTSSEVDTTGKILFLEEVNEYLYHIDRMMWHLKRSGKLENLAGLLVGQFTKIHDEKDPFGLSAYEIIAELTKEHNYPIYFDFPAGHDKHNVALMLGKEVKLQVFEHQAKLTFLS